jgi:hypothetical protein
LAKVSIVAGVIGKELDVEKNKEDSNIGILFGK